ncbi:DUF3857 domain-containing protein, partial [bacterium]|nr:DUF3857 domain-containing protein [bacterium]
AAALEPPQPLPPAEAVALLAAEAPDELVGEADQLVLFERESVIVEDSGLGHRYRHRFVKALEPAGALALAALRFDYDPASNVLDLRLVRVHRADSSWVDIDPALARDVPQPTDLINWGARMKVLGLPPLAVGDGVETLTYSKGFLIAYLAADEPEQPRQLEVLKPVPAGEAMSLLDSTVASVSRGGSSDERYIPPMRGHFYDVQLFQSDLPQRERRYTVSLPATKPLQYSVYNGEVMSSLRFAGDRHDYAFWKENVPALVHEPRMPDASDVVPKVVMATTEDWEAKSRWFAETNEWTFAHTPEIAAKVRDITRGLDTDEEKVAALLHWVAQNIRYFGLTMGKGEGYTLHPGEMTFRDRAGVCKDIAGMLVTMLRAAGYEAYGAMTMAGARVEDIPADQFNHCVVALKKPDGSFQMLDPTWAPWNNPTWSRWEGEQDYVIGDFDGQDLMQIPAFSPEDNLLSVKSTAQLGADGALDGTLEFTGRGVSDGRLRGVVADRAARDLRPYLENWLGALTPRAELVDFSFSDHRDFTRDTTLRLRYRLPGWAEDLGDSLALRSPALALLAGNGALWRLAGLPKAKERVHPYFIWAGQRVELSESLELPRGNTWAAPPAIDEKETQASFRCDWKPERGRLDLTAALQVDRRLIQPEDWPGLRAVADAIEARAAAGLTAGRSASRKGGAR